MKNKLLGNRVLLEVVQKETVTSSGLVLNVEDSPDDMRIGKVVAVGTGRDTEQGHVDIKISVGEEVMFHYGTNVRVDEKDYVLVNADDVIMVFVK